MQFPNRGKNMAAIIGRFGPYSPNDPPEKYCPIVTVGPGKDQLGSSANLLTSSLTAMIDTGAQDCAIDPEIAERFKLPVKRQETIVGLGATGSIAGKVYNAQIYFSETRSLHEIELYELPLRSRSWLFDIIIGWTLLNLFELTLSRPRNLVRLEMM
jgi:predicted aspartyl protease